MSTSAQVPNQPDWFDANGQQIPPQSTAQQPSGDWFSDNSPDAGQVTNDVGNKIIVSKPNESFADTMARVRAYGRTVTQDQIDKEMATAPRKVATVLTAAPAIGVAGTAGIAASDMGIYQAAKGLGYAGEAVKDALSHPVGRYLLKRAVDAGLGAGVFQYAMHSLKKAGMFSK